MKSKRTFDRDYNLWKETPQGLCLPDLHCLAQIKSKRYPWGALRKLHVVREGLRDGQSLEFLCGNGGDVAWEYFYLSADTEYTFCMKCQRAAKKVGE